MTATETRLTMREHFENAIKSADEAEQVLVDKGATATDDDYKAADEASARMQQAFTAWDNSEKGGAARAAMADQREEVDGKTFDELASASGVINPQGMTVGEAFVKSGAFEELVDVFKRNDGRLADKIGKSRTVDFAVALTSLRDDLKFVEGDGVAEKALVTGATAAAGGAAIPQPTRLPGFADQDPVRRQTIWDLCTKIPLTTDVLEYVELTAATNNAAPVAEATSAGGLASAGHTDAVTDVAGGLKPESGLTFAQQTNQVENIAHWVPITRRAAADAPQLVQIINTFGIRGAQAAAEDQIMNGDGTSPNLRGLINTTNAYNIQSLDISVAAITRLDGMARASALIMDGLEGEYMPNGIVVHPLDWFSDDFMLAKDTQGNYLGAGPFAGLEALRQLWGTRAVVSKAVPQGTQVVGDFTEALIGDRMQASMYMSDSHADYFLRNILTMLFEQRLSFGLRVPQAFVSVVA